MVPEVEPAMDKVPLVEPAVPKVRRAEGVVFAIPTLPPKYAA